MHLLKSVKVLVDQYSLSEFNGENYPNNRKCSMPFLLALLVATPNGFY